MRVEFPRPNDPVMICEPGDPIGLIFPAADLARSEVACAPVPLPESGQLVWTVAVAGIYAWALFNRAGVLQWVGNHIPLEAGEQYVFVEGNG